MCRATTEIHPNYHPLSLHASCPISVWLGSRLGPLATLRKSVETLSGLSWTWLRDTIFALITTKDGRVTPLNGRYFTQIIATSFKDMRTTGDGAALLPRRGTFDLFLTRTDLHGWPRHLPVTRDFHPSALFERTHAHVMAFRQRDRKSTRLNSSH